jgi:hypothetical protein
MQWLARRLFLAAAATALADWLFVDRAGLGLSLAAAVARLHGGTLRIEDNAPGLRVVLALPRAAPATHAPSAALSPAVPLAPPAE